MSLAWSLPTQLLRWIKTSTKSIFALPANTKAHEYKNDHS
jgi:hypothetical protein